MTTTSMSTVMADGSLGFMHEKHTLPDARGERVAAFVEDYLRTHPGLSLGELAFRLRADKRDLQRLLNARSVGWKLEDNLAAYFGDIFVEAVFRPVIGDGPSRRQQELDRERAEIAARAERLARTRAECRRFRTDPVGVAGVRPDQDREANF
jgi:hypothetical protein